MVKAKANMFPRTPAKRIHLTVAQKNDRSLGLVKFTRPLVSHLESLGTLDSKNLAEVVSEMASFMAAIRSKCYWGETSTSTPGEYEKRLKDMAAYLNKSIENCVSDALNTAF